MIEIPIECEGGSFVTLSCNVGSVKVSFRLLWNERDGAWYCDFESVNGTNNGVRLVENSLLLRSKKRAVGDGDFVILKGETASDEALGFDSLGTVYKMYFIPQDEMALFDGVLT